MAVPLGSESPPHQPQTHPSQIDPPNFFRLCSFVTYVAFSNPLESGPSNQLWVRQVVTPLFAQAASAISLNKVSKEIKRIHFARLESLKPASLRTFVE